MATVGSVAVRIYGDLRFFVDDDCDGQLDVPSGAPRSVKDLVEAAGVPHPEVGLLLCNGEPVGFSTQVRPGDRVAVYPPFTTISVPNAPLLRPARPVPAWFVCDVHLGTLTRRLRLLGFDTWYQTDTDDAELTRVAAAEDRILLSRDRGLLMRASVTHGYCPRSDEPDTQALEVVSRFRLGDELKPFTRCVNCNGRLQPVAKADVAAQLGPRTRVEHNRFARCADCGQIYWPGSHIDRMSAFVSAASAASRPEHRPI
jgi:uncharacterized protein with PIN domain